jgi:hypothetical protein
MIRVSDIFIDAPDEIYHSLALILLAKLYRKRVDTAYHRTYRTFIPERHDSGTRPKAFATIDVAARGDGALRAATSI